MTSGARPNPTTTLRRAALVAPAALLALLLPATAGAYAAPASQKPASGPQTRITEANVRQKRELKPVLWWGHDSLHARYYSNTLGRFVSVDPVGGDVGSSQSWNRYSYVMNNPLGFVDPTGKYGRGAGFSDEEWEKFQKAQAAAAKKMERRAEKLEQKAAKREAKGKRGAGELRAEADNLRAGASVLRSDGTDGYVAFGVHTSDIMLLQRGEGAEGLKKASFTPAGTFVCSSEVWVNVDHPVWSNPYKAQRTIGHESLHNIGLHDEPRGDPPLAYKRGFPEQIKRFNASVPGLRTCGSCGCCPPLSSHPRRGCEAASSFSC